MGDPKALEEHVEAAAQMVRLEDDHAAGGHQRTPAV